MTRLFSPKSIQNKTIFTITLLLKEQLQLGLNGETFGSQREDPCYSNLVKIEEKIYIAEQCVHIRYFYAQHPELFGVGYFK